MRVPIPLVLLCCLAVVGGTWWYGTRNSDFLTPPTDSELADLRARVEASIPPPDQPDDAVSAPPRTSESTPPAAQSTPPKPTIDPGDLTRPPTLDEYSAFGSQGPETLIDLATLLESKGQFQRGLLAWERVIDTSKPDDAQATATIAAIQRLRPTLPDWNTDPSLAIPVMLHAGTGKSAAAALTPVLEETARELEKASAGILKVTAVVTAGKTDLTTDGPTPAALWFAGPSDNARSTEVLSFTFESPAALRDEVLKTTFAILRGYIARTVSLTPPRAMTDGELPIDALQTHISRWTWQEFGAVLNLPPDSNE